MNIFIGLLIGIAAGSFGGLFGIGGGLVMVPAMVYFLHFSQKMSQGTSLAVLCTPVGILGAMNYYKNGNVDFKTAGIIAAGFIGGSFLGSKIAIGLSEVTMRKAFAVFLVLVALQMWFKSDSSKPAPEESSSQASASNLAPTNSK